jgi:hypothetical protein
MNRYRAENISTEQQNDLMKRRRAKPSIQEQAKFLLDLLNEPLDEVPEQALAISYAHAQESRGWK